MDRCDDYKKRIWEGDVSDEVLQHIATCESCLREFEESSKLTELIGFDSEMPDAPDCSGVVLSKIRAESAQSRRWNLAFLWGPVMSAAVVAAIVIGLNRPTAVDISPKPKAEVALSAETSPTPAAVRAISKPIVAAKKVETAKLSPKISAKPRRVRTLKRPPVVVVATAALEEAKPPVPKPAALLDEAPVVMAAAMPEASVRMMGSTIETKSVGSTADALCENYKKDEDKRPVAVVLVNWGEGSSASNYSFKKTDIETGKTISCSVTRNNGNVEINCSSSAN